MSDYIERRLLDAWLANQDVEERYKTELKKRMKYLTGTLQKQIDAFLDRWQTETGLDTEAINAALSRQESHAWRQELIDARAEAIAGGYADDTKNTYYKQRVNRSQQLQSQLYHILAKQAAIEEQKAQEHLINQYKNTFDRYHYELTEGGNVGFSINYTKFSETKLKKALLEPWERSNYSKRTWGILTYQIPNALKHIMSRDAVTGEGIDNMRKELTKFLGTVPEYKMNRLIQTESTHINERASQDLYDQIGVDKWVWSATLESHTCPICGDRDQKVYTKGQPDEPRIPAHPNCRCKSTPYIEGWSVAKRWSRDPITGKGTKVPYMNFNEWKKYNGLDAKTKEPEKVLGGELDKLQGANKFKEQLAAAPAKNQAAWDKYKDTFKLYTAPGKGDHYSPTNDAVHLTKGSMSGKDEYNSDGKLTYRAGSTFFHEFGHMMDKKANKRGGWSYRSDEFQGSNGQTLGVTAYNEVQEHVKRFKQETGEKYIRNARERLGHKFAGIVRDTKNAADIATVTDLFGGATKNAVRGIGTMGHSKGYWSRDLYENIGAEAFAEMYSATTRNAIEELDYIQEYLPETFKIFQELLDDIIKGG